jgi:hypothetical protein
MRGFRIVVLLGVMFASLLAAAPVSGAAGHCDQANFFQRSSTYGASYYEGQSIQQDTSVSGIVATFSIAPGTTDDCDEYTGDPLNNGFLLTVELADNDGETDGDNGFVRAGVMKTSIDYEGSYQNWDFWDNDSNCPTVWGNLYAFTDLYAHQGFPPAEDNGCGRYSLVSGTTFKVRIDAGTLGHTFVVYFDYTNDGTYDQTVFWDTDAQFVDDTKYIARIRLVLLDSGTEVGTSDILGKVIANNVQFKNDAGSWQNPDWTAGNNTCAWRTAETAHGGGWKCDINSPYRFQTYRTDT